jgi:hypothetical protein
MIGKARDRAKRFGTSRRLQSYGINLRRGTKARFNAAFGCADAGSAPASVPQPSIAT